MLVPKLRFKREDGTSYPEWEIIRLGELCTLTNGISKGKDYFGHGNRMVNLQDVFSSNWLTDNSEFDLVEVTPKELEEKRIIKGDVLFIRSSVKPSGVGLPCVIATEMKDTVFSGFIIRARFFQERLDIGYKRYCFLEEDFRNAIMKKCSVSANTNINQENLENIGVKTPCLEEQQKIADFLSTVDEVIAQSEAEVQNLEQQKKAMMQKIFSQEVRFKRENGTEYPEWVESTIGEEMGFVNGKAHENCEDDNGDYIIVNSKFISTNGEVIRKTNTVLVPLHIGDIVMVMSDVPNGKAMSKCLVIDKDKQYTLNQRICALRSTHKPIFVSAQISRCAYFLSFDDGVKQTNLRKQDVLDCPLFIADKEEQQKIADFLSSYDEAISYAKQELDKWKELNKGLLQQMFV